MKFLCPSCKAKYQIADEKIAGKPVRMKCRKCGYEIRISKLGEVAPLGAAGSTPPPPDDTHSAGALAPPSPRPPATGSSPSAAKPPPARAPLGSSPLGAAAPRLAGARPATTPLRAPPSHATTHGGGPLARPGAVAPPPRRPAPSHAGASPAPAAVPRATPRATPTPAGTGTPAGARAVAPSPAPAAAVRSATPGAAAYAAEDDERTIIAGAGALAGAFAAAVGAAPVSTALEDLASASEDWHVGINGVPMGPMRLSELRSKAGSGAVTAESLVWRDGFEEWLPLKNFPELLAIVEEGLSSARASRLPPEPLASAAPPAAVAAVGAPVAAVGALSDPFKPSRAAVVSEQAAGDFDLDAVIPPRRGTSPAAWIAVAVALLFGLTIGFVVFNKDKPAEQIVKYVEVPASGSKGTPGEPGAASTAAATGDDKDAGAPAAGAGGKLVAKGAPAAKSGEPPSSKPTGLSGLDGLSGLQGPGGPKAPSGDGSGAGSSGEPLDGAKVQATVSRYTSSVRRSCWQPALDARDKDAPTSARVSVTIKVAPSGSVQSVSTSGDPKGYHGLAGCIGSKVRGWQFPPSSGSTTVNVPFVFAAQ